MTHAIDAEVNEDTFPCRDCGTVTTEHDRVEGSDLCRDCWRDREVTYAEDFAYDDAGDVA